MIMLPLVFQEKLLAGLDQQIRSLIADEERDIWDKDAALFPLCMAPWEVAAAFHLATGDPAPVIDRYGLKAVCIGDGNMLGCPADNAWAVDCLDERFIPLFSPFDVWKATRRKERGDDGVDLPPVTCDTDRLLRNLCRGYELPQFRVSQLASNAHDLFVLAAALSEHDHDDSLTMLEGIAAECSLWKTNDRLAGEAAEIFRNAYASTPLQKLRLLLGVTVEERKCFSAEWVSPSIIPLIESSESFRDTTSQPKWLLYKSVMILKGTLPEERHNRMLAEAMNGDKYAKAYLEFLRKDVGK